MSRRISCIYEFGWYNVPMEVEYMSETRYLISETAKITQTEPHVLRYWEEELGLEIGRNEMGHRYYTDKDIRTFLKVKELKKKGLQLRAIRKIVLEEEQGEEIPEGLDISVKETQLDKPDKQNRESEAGGPNIIRIQERRGEETAGEGNVKHSRMARNSSEKSKEERFGEIMQRLIRDIELGERKEGRYRRLDEAIRRHQQSRKMVAATEENIKKKKRKNRKSKKNTEKK